MCTVRGLMADMHANVHLYLSRGTQLLSRGDTNVNHSMIALAKDSEEFECRLEMGNVVKVDTKKILVTGKYRVLYGCVSYGLEFTV